MSEKKLKTVEEVVNHCLEKCPYFGPACITFTEVEASWCYIQAPCIECPMLEKTNKEQ